MNSPLTQEDIQHMLQKFANLPETSANNCYWCQTATNIYGRRVLCDKHRLQLAAAIVKLRSENRDVPERDRL